MKNVQDFLNFLEKMDVKVALVKEKHIKEYIMELKISGVSNNTINRRNTALRLYFKYLRKQGIMLINPFEDIKQLDANRRGKNFSEEEVLLLETLMSEKDNNRDNVLFSLSYYEKLKVSEIVKLKKADYNESQGIIYADKKAVLVSEKTKELLKVVLQNQRTEYLLTNHHNKPLTEPGAYFILKNYFKEIGREDLRPIDLVK